MLTGYNTDVSYGGELFHVQTEDKGINSPIILSLVYRAGTILAAKRTPYNNYIQNGVVDESAVSQILNRQHQILVAAIRSGKSDKLVELSRHYSEYKGKEICESPSASSTQATSVTRRAIETQAKEVSANDTSHLSSRPQSAPAHKLEPQTHPVAHNIEQRGFDAISFDQIIAGFLEKVSFSEQLRIELLYPSKFRAGDEVTVRAAVFVGGHTPSSGAKIQLQVLGTKIVAQSWQAVTDFQGLVSFHIKIPVFTSGAAALILKATAENGQDTEAKFMISAK
ncbi:MAG: hypothetical protein JST84_02410 [Acidobacteria bacterium]|nr:hypothetical protein [Acidobacteriota bacterium]